MLIKKKFSLILVFCIALSVLFASCDNSDAEAEEISANVITQSDTGAPSGSDTESESGTPAETQIVAVTDSQGEVVTNAQGGAVTEVTSVTEPLPVSALSPDESKKIEELITQSATQATTVVSKSSIADGAKYAYNTLTDDDFNTKRLNSVEQIRPVAYWKIAKHFKLFAGPTFNLYIGDNTDKNPLNFHIPYALSHEEMNTNSTKFVTWIGFTAGIRF